MRTFIVLIFISSAVFSQKIDSAKVINTKKIVLDSVKKKAFFKNIIKTDSANKRNIPKTVLIRSLILPGWGQATNKQYWVIPIVYGAAAAGLFSTHWNNYRYFYYKNALRVLLNSKAETIKVRQFETGGFLGYKTLLNNPIDTDTRTLTKAQIEPGIRAFHRQRDLSYIIFGAGWALQAIQANVTAHLKGFDMNEDISLKLEPDFQSTSFGNAAGVKLRLNF